VSTYGFNERDAKRVGKAVRQSERMPPKVKLGGPQRGGANPGVRIMLGTVHTNAWNKRSTALVTIYAGDPGGNGLPTASAGTVVCWNIMADIGSVTTAVSTATSVWVQMSYNGFAGYALGVECRD
jgi:hypothetical protein